MNGVARRARLIATAVLTSLVLGACAAPPPGEPGVAHVVIVWLNDPDDSEARAALVHASLGFESIDGVEQVLVGGPIESDRPIVDDSFDLSIVVVLRDRAALETYLAHPDHVRAGREVLAPAAARVLVYDSNLGHRAPGARGAIHEAP